MKYFLISLIALFIAGCGDTRAVHGDVQAPPSTHQTSEATEDLMAQRAAALARAKVDDAEKRAATSGAARAIADAAGMKDRADAAALKKEIAEQRTVENAGRFDRGYWVAGLLLLLAGFLLYERNMLAAGRAALSALAIIVTVQALSFAATHETLILGTAVLLGGVELAWHFRGKLATVEAALMHEVHGLPWADAEKRVQLALIAAWSRGLSVLDRIEIALRLKSKPAPAPVVAPITPPAN